MWPRLNFDHAGAPEDVCLLFCEDALPFPLRAARLIASL
jgi:hypothetical protein